VPHTPTVTVASLRVPQAAWKHFDRAKSAEEHNRPEEFERETAKALEIAPDFAEIHMLRAKQLARARRFTEEVDEAIAARRADPGVMWAGVMLAGAYNSLRRYKDARLVLDTEHGIEADSWQAMYERARAEVGLRNAEAALHWSGMMLKAAPEKFPDARLVRANALMLAERWSEAKTQMQIYLQSKPPQDHRTEVLAMQKLVAARIETASR
jgi:predicted Zn-dependent protease